MRTQKLLMVALVLVQGIAVRDGNGQGMQPDPNSGGAVTLLRELLGSLDGAAKKTTQFPFSAEERTQWRRDPAQRPGLAIKDMSETQRGQVDQLLKTVLSDLGFRTVKGIMEEQNLLGAKEEGLGAGYYWLAVYGQPGEGQWAWRLGGHHVSLHVTYSGTEVVSCTPLMLGGEMEGDQREGWKGYEFLKDREDLARGIVKSGGDLLANMVRISEAVPENLIMSEPKCQPLTDSDPGLRLSKMSEAQRKAVEQLVERYLSVFNVPLRDAELRRFRRKILWAKFAWAGSFEAKNPHYYRIQSPVFLIEYTNTGTHMHTIIRTDVDFGTIVAAP